MRIGISCYSTVGGSGAVATELGKALAHRGHQVHFIVTDIPFRLGEFHQNIFVHQLETVSYPVLRTPPYDLALAAKMADMIEHYDLQILHVHYALPFAVCAFLAKEMIPHHPVKIVTTLHGTDVTVLAQDKSLFNVIKLGIEKSDYVTAVSHNLVQQTKELFQIDRKIECVHNFIDTDVFHPMAPSSLRSCFASKGEKVLLHMSNFRAVKRIPDVINIFARVRESIKSKLLLVGEGPELATAREMVCTLGIREDVKFLGRQDEVASLFAAADLFLLPSQKESFGLVALEAMASGTPVVGSNAGGIPEVVVHGETGFLASTGDVERMANYAVELLSSPAMYQEFQQNGLRLAKNRFNLHDKIEQYERIYEDLLQVVNS